MRFEVSKKCNREFDKNTTLKNAAKAIAEKACAGQTGIGRGNCMSHHYGKYQLANINKFCPNDPHAIVPENYGFTPTRHFLTPTKQWYGNSGGYGGEGAAALLSSVKNVDSSGEKVGHDQEQIQKYLMFGAGAFLLLALIKPAVQQAK